jgi:hypothetical protein
MVVPPSRHGVSAALHSCRAEVSSDLLDEQGNLLDWLIGLAFDTLAIDHLDVRVTPSLRSRLEIAVA